MGSCFSVHPCDCSPASAPGHVAIGTGLCHSDVPGPLAPASPSVPILLHDAHFHEGDLIQQVLVPPQVSRRLLPCPSAGFLTRTSGTSVPQLSEGQRRTCPLYFEGPSVQSLAELLWVETLASLENYRLFIPSTLGLCIEHLPNFVSFEIRNVKSVISLRTCLLYTLYSGYFLWHVVLQFWNSGECAMSSFCLSKWSMDVEILKAAIYKEQCVPVTYCLPKGHEIWPFVSVL